MDGSLPVQQCVSSNAVKGRKGFYNPLKGKGLFSTSVLSSHQNKDNCFCLVGFHFCFLWQGLIAQACFEIAVQLMMTLNS